MDGLESGADDVDEMSGDAVVDEMSRDAAGAGTDAADVAGRADGAAGGAAVKRLARVIVAVVAAAGGYVALLAVAGVVAKGCVVDRARVKMARALAADVTIGDADVSLLRGRIALRDVVIARPTGPHLAATIDAIDADLASMGWLVVDRTIDDLTARGVSISISAAGAATLPLAEREDRPPIHARRLVLRDVHLEAVVSGYLPGLGRVVVDIDRARTGAIDVRDVVSWLYRVREVDARVTLPGGVTGTARYDGARLRLGGGLLGAEPVELPLALPVPPPDQLEGAQLRDLATRLAAEIGVVLVKRKAMDSARGWLRHQVGGGVMQRMDGLLRDPTPDADADAGTAP